MSYWMMAAQAAMYIGEEVLSRDAASAEAKAQKKLQRYRNTMVGITAGESQNAVTTNTTLQMMANARESFDIQRNQIQAEGEAAVAAGAAGVAGGSTDALMQDVRRNAARRQYQRGQDLRGIFMSEGAQRRSIAMQAETAKTTGYFPKPSTAASLLNLGGKGLSLYNEYDKEGYFD